MLRRKFIQISGLSAGSFLFTAFDHQTGIPYKVMRYPDTVAVRCSGEWYSLQGTTDSWKYNAIQVSFRLNGDSLSLFINAPQLELEMIRCNWKQTFNHRLQNTWVIIGKEHTEI